VVTLDLVNIGVLQHELMIGRDVEMDAGKPSRYHEDMFEIAGIEPEVNVKSSMGMEPDHSEDNEVGHGDGDHEGFMVVLPPGEDTATITFTVTDEMMGEWEIGCFELDGVHYNAGMVGSLKVTR